MVCLFVFGLFWLNICGFFVTMYENSLAYMPGSVHRELVMVLEDRASTGYCSKIWCLRLENAFC